MRTLLVLTIASITWWVANGQSQSSCLVQTRFEPKGDSGPFSLQQQQCIADYVHDVQQLLPDYTLSQRRFGGRHRSRNAPILGAGFGSTASRSLAVFGRQLGLKVHHYDPFDWPLPSWFQLDELLTKDCTERYQLDQVNFSDLLQSGSDMFLDTPMGELFLDFYAASPESKVILTLRDPESWAMSRSTHFGDQALPVQSPCGGLVKHLSVEVAAKLFESHVKLVRCMVPPEKLLEVNTFESQLNSTAIARFFGVTTKYEVPFPIVGSPAESFEPPNPRPSSRSGPMATWNDNFTDVHFVKGDRLPLCITGQVRRLELESKIKHFIEPALAAGHRLEVYLVIDPRLNTSYIHRGAGSLLDENYTVMEGPFQQLKDTAALFGRNITVVFDPFIPQDHKIDPRYAMNLESVSGNDAPLKKAMLRATSHVRQWEALQRCWQLISSTDTVNPAKVAVRLRDDLVILERFLPPFGSMARGVHVQNCEDYYGLNDKAAIVVGDVESYFTKPLQMMLQNFTQLMSLQRSRCSRPLNPESVLFNSMVLAKVSSHLTTFPIRPGIWLYNSADHQVNMCYAQGLHFRGCFSDELWHRLNLTGKHLYRANSEELNFICEP